MRVDALGWSGFLVTEGEVAVAFDPQWSMWRAPGLLPPWDLHPLHVLVVSHGHADHYRDVPHLLALHPRAVLVGAPELVADAEARPGLAGRGVVAPTAGWGPAGPVWVRRVPGAHVAQDPAGQVRRFLRYLGRRPFGAGRLVAHHLLDGDRGGVAATLLRLPSGATVLHAPETLHRRTDLDALLRGLDGVPVDLLLLGLEPGEEEAALAHARALHPGALLAFTPHGETRAWFGVDEAAEGVRPALATAAGAVWMQAGDRWSAEG